MANPVIVNALPWQVREEGWVPQHVLVRNAETRELLGAAPMYLKGHSYGEYIFDNVSGPGCHDMGISGS